MNAVSTDDANKIILYIRMFIMIYLFVLHDSLTS